MAGSHSSTGVVVTADLIFPFNKGCPSRGVQPCCPRDTSLICLLNHPDCCCCCGSAVSTSSTPRTAARQASLSFPISWSLLKLMPSGSMMPSNHLSVCRPLLNLLLLHHFSRVRLCATPETAAHQAPPSLGFSRQEHWSGLPFPSPVHESEK